MTTGVALPCPCCKRLLESHAWHDAKGGTCPICEVEFKFFPFPALTATQTRIPAQAAALAEESVCFFHAENRAEAVCEICGRLLCRVCCIEFGGQKICPTCVATAKKSDAVQAVQERPLYDSLALSLATLPLLLWPFTFLSAPVALGFVFYGWRKPGSLVRGPSRARFVIAVILALLQILAWVILIFSLWRRRRL